MNEERITYKVLYNEIQKLRDEFTRRFDQLECNYITRKEFDPVRNLVYGAVGLVLTAALAALIKLIFIDG
jgi:hypothetical protein